MCRYTRGDAMISSRETSADVSAICPAKHKHNGGCKCTCDLKTEPLSTLSIGQQIRNVCFKRRLVTKTDIGVEPSLSAA